MTAPLEIRRDRTAVVLRKAAKAESDARIARRMLATRCLGLMLVSSSRLQRAFGSR